MLTFDSSFLTAQLAECLRHLQSLENHFMVQDKFVPEFKMFLHTLNACFSEFIRNATLVFASPSKTRILLCLSQISKSLKLFAVLLRRPLYRQGVWYVCERLRCCLSELRGVCLRSDLAEDGDDSGQFLRRVDAALQRLETLGAAATQQPSWAELINDIVCQAVTIAKIASTLDYNEITSACQRILELNSEMVSEDQLDSNQQSLLADLLFNSLASLEERVNVAILRLVLQVFSEPCRPLKQIVRQCGQAPPSRSLSDLDPLVDELDSHTERVMLIGQFAVSCCDDAARVRSMKCCLASVESIDNYLVPALKALYLTSSCEDKRKFAGLLCDHWQEEAKALHSHLDNIIDSSAFSKVVRESISDMSVRLGRGEDEAGRTVAKQGWLLYTHLSATGSGVARGDLTRLKQSLCELEAAITKKVSLSAVVKRVGLVVAAVDQISDQLTGSQLSPNQPSADTTASESSNVVKSIRDLPLDISVSSAKSQYASYRPQWLRQKICEVKKNRLDERTVSKSKFDAESSNDPPAEIAATPKRRLLKNVYETPKSTVKPETDLLTPFLSKTTERNTTLYVRTPRRVVQEQMMDISSATDCSWATVNGSDSLALEISDILDNLSMLADTLSSNKESEAMSWQQPQPTPPADVMKRYFSGSSFDSQWFSQASVRTDEVSADVDTLERIQDLKQVDDKIRSLKLL